MRQDRLLGDLLRRETASRHGRENTSTPWVARGRRHARLGDMIGALRCYREAVSADPDSYRAWVELSSLFQNLEDETRSARCLGVARRLLNRSARISAGI